MKWHLFLKRNKQDIARVVEPPTLALPSHLLACVLTAANQNNLIGYAQVAVFIMDDRSSATI
jgi:hypothetical protein